MSAIHAVLAGANVGILVFATGSFAARFVMKNDSKWADYADKMSFVSAIVGVSLAVLTGLAGYFFTWSPEAVRSTLLTQNKILVTVALLASWGMFVVLRWRAGEAMWASTPLKLWALLLVAFGFINIVLVGSMGGSAALMGTLLDPAIISLNINRYTSLSWGAGISIAVILLSLVVTGFSYTKRNR